MASMRLGLTFALAPLVCAACGDGDPTASIDLPVPAQGRPFYDPDAVRPPAPAPGGGATADAAATPGASPTSEAPRAAEGSGTSDSQGGDSGGASTAENDPLAKYGWTRDRDGYIQISYLDLALDGLDQELLVEKLLYPEDYEDVELEWPERVRALDGQRVALTGYMLPLLWKETTVPHFMLVRDLMACCFGGAPKPDEWTDVKMDGEGAGYWSYVPVVTRGVFRLGGLADEAGYAAGAYSIEGHDVRREL